MPNKSFFDVPKTFLFSAYAFICGFTYICGFWYNFNIDLNIVFSLLSPLDIIKSFIIPIISALGVVIIHLLANQINNLGDTESSDFFKQTRKEYLQIMTLKIPMALFSQISLVVLISILSTTYLAYKTFATNERFYLTSFLIGSAGIAVMIAIYTVSLQFTPDKLNRHLISIFFVCILPAIIYITGVYNGKGAIKDKKLIVMMDNSQCSVDPKEKFVLLSLYGSKGISVSLKNKSICLFEAEKTSFKSLPPNHT
ncbi:hypothetical protein ACINJI_003726 [Cronobacter dublinensis]